MIIIRRIPQSRQQQQIHQLLSILQFLHDLYRFGSIMQIISLKCVMQRHFILHQNDIIPIMNEMDPSDKRVATIQIRRHRIFIEHSVELGRHFWVRNEHREILNEIVVFFTGDVIDMVWIIYCSRHQYEPVMWTPYFCIQF